MITGSGTRLLKMLDSGTFKIQPRDAKNLKSPAVSTPAKCQSEDDCKYCGFSLTLSSDDAADCGSKDDCAYCRPSTFVAYKKDCEDFVDDLVQSSTVNSCKSMPINIGRVRLVDSSELTVESKRLESNLNRKVYCDPSCDLLEKCNACRRPEEWLVNHKLSECQSYNSCGQCADDSMVNKSITSDKQTGK